MCSIAKSILKKQKRKKNIYDALDNFVGKGRPLGEKSTNYEIAYKLVKVLMHIVNDTLGIYLSAAYFTKPMLDFLMKCLDSKMDVRLPQARDCCKILLHAMLAVHSQPKGTDTNMLFLQKDHEI